DINIAGSLGTDSLARTGIVNTNTALRLLIDDRLQVANAATVYATNANTNAAVAQINTNLTSTNTALRTLISDRAQVANVAALAALANTNSAISNLNTNLTSTNTAIRTLVDDRLQVANASTIYATNANTNAAVAQINTNLTSTNTALRTLISDRAQVANVAALAALANTNSAISNLNTNLTGTNTAIRSLVSTQTSRVDLVNTNLTSTNTALRTLISDRLQVANAEARYSNTAQLANTNSRIATLDARERSALANTNAYIASVSSSATDTLARSGITATNTALRTLISDRLQVANASTIYATNANTNSSISQINTNLTSTNTALRTLISDRLQVANAAVYLQVANAFTSSDLTAGDGITLSAGVDIATSTSASKNTSVSEEPNYQDVMFSPDGTKMILYSWQNRILRQHTLSSAWDVSTASYDSSTNFSVSSQISNAGHAGISDNGKHIIVGGEDSDRAIYQYTFSSTNTADDGLGNLAYASNSFEIPDGSGQELESHTIRGIAYLPEGNKIAILGFASSTPKVVTYDLSTPYDLSTADSSSGAEIALGAKSGSSFTNLTMNSLQFSDDNTSFYTIVYNYTGNADGVIRRYDMSTASDVTSANGVTGSTSTTAAAAAELDTISLLPTNAEATTGFFIKEDQSFLAVLSVLDDKVHQFTMGGGSGTTIAATFSQTSTDARYANTAQLANTNSAISNLNTNLTGTNTAIRTLVSDRLQVANASTIYATNANTNSSISQINTNLTSTNTALRTLISDRAQVANVASLAALANTNAYIATKADIASPTFTGTPAAPTAAAATNTTQIATTAFVRTEVANLVDSAPGALDTLNELAAALGDDANFSTTVTNSIATKLAVSNAATIYATNANTNAAVAQINTNLTSTNTALRTLISDRLQVANASTIYATNANTNAAVSQINTNLTSTNTALRTLISDRLQVANAAVYLQVANSTQYLQVANAFTASSLTAGDGITLTQGVTLTGTSYDSKSVSVNSQDANPDEVILNPSGTTMLLGGETNYSIFQFTLSSAFDISTASYDSTSFSFSSQTTSVGSVHVEETGTYVIVLNSGTKTIYQYTMSTPFDLSTMSYTRSVQLPNGSDERYESAVPRYPHYLDSGNKVGIWRSSGSSVIYDVYDLSSAYDISGVTGSPDASSSDLDSTYTSPPRNSQWSSDGKTLWTIQRNYGGTDDGLILQHDVTTAFDVTTITVSAEASFDTLDQGISPTPEAVNSLWIDESQSKLYVLNVLRDSIHQFSMGGGSGTTIAATFSQTSTDARYANTAQLANTNSAISNLNTNLTSTNTAIRAVERASLANTNAYIATMLPKAGGQMTGNITFSGSQTVDGRDLSADGSKLDGIESGATADQTAADIRGLGFFDTSNDGSGSGLDADTVDGIQGASFLRSDADDTATGRITLDDDLVFSNRTTTDGHIHLYQGSLSGGYAIGVEASTTYYRSNANHRWYINSFADGGSSDRMELTTSGLSLTGNITVSGTVDG
ncbi:MAG: hypothetical protein VW270_09530, partial [Candidatus Poseidoniales archaeon]